MRPDPEAPDDAPLGTTECGFSSMIVRSLCVPGSPSSAFTTRKAGLVAWGRMKLHFTPMGKPAPPRPRMFAFFASSTTCSRVHPAEDAARGLVAGDLALG